MRNFRGAGAARAAALVACCLAGAAQARPGADVIVGELPDVSNFAAAGGFDAFAVGTTSCNIGTVNLNWYTASNSQYDWDNRHPTIGQNLFRLHNGRFEQIGQAWLKHGFTALAGNVCGTCNGSSGTVLGVGCSDPYSSSLNGGQGGLGPKWQVNASNGIFPYPFANSSGSGSTYKRLRVRLDDLNATTYAGALYFVEGHYICGDDADSGNDNNNASYRRVTFSGTTDYAMALTGTTIREQPAIYAWQAADPTVTLTTVDVPNDGRYIVGCKVTNNAGVYTYEYAVHNLNSHRSAGSFSVPYPSGTSIANVGFHDVEYHSGEPNAAGDATPSADDWTPSVGGTAVTWSGVAYSGTGATYSFHPTVQYMLDGSGTGSSAMAVWAAGSGNDHSGNALRWGALSNFRFTTTTAPATGAVQIGLWRPGTGSAAFATVPTPGGATGGAPTTGVCCTGQTCTVTTPAGCGGVFGGLGTTCGPNTCSSGACCAPAGTCSVTSPTGCTAGTYQGNGTTCSPNPCAVPTGACCVGSSCSSTTQAACAGVYIGNGSTCSPNPCASNDLCAGALPLCDGVPINGNNSTAANEGSVTCDSGSTGSGRDVWFKYTPSGTSGTVAVTITTDNALITGGTTAFDTVLTVFSACGGTELACDDDAGTNPGNSSRITNFSMTRGQTYIIRVASYGTVAGGNFSVMVSGGGGTGCQGPSGSCCNAGNCSVGQQSACSTGTWTEAGTCSPNICAPANNDCSNRAGVGTGTTPFNNTYATTDGPAHNPGCAFFNNNQIERDLWWNFPSTFTGQLRIDTCGSSYDTKIAVYDDTGCTNYDARLLACDDDNSFCGTNSRQSSVTINVIPNRSYTIRVGSYGTTEAGAGLLNITAIPVVTQGACCDVGTGCHIVANQAACGAGVFQGVGSTCSPDPCPAPNNAPTAVASAANVTTGGGSGYVFTVTYSDDVAVNVATLDSSDVRVTGPGGFSVSASFVSLDTPGNGTPRIGTYMITPPGGSWDLADNGSYNVSMEANQVADSNGAFVAAGVIGSFNVSVPAPTGACCNGTSCAVATQAACGGAYQGNGSACGASGNPTTCCPANYNQSGGLSVQDIFDFLAGYFAGDAAADFNGGGGLSVQDIFDFLAAYFAGCPG